MKVLEDTEFVGKAQVVNPNPGNISKRLDVLDKVIGEAYDACLTFVQNTESVRKLSTDHPGHEAGQKEQKSEIENRVDKQIERVVSIVRLMQDANGELRL